MRVSPPAPMPSAIGSVPAKAANVVIMIGRNRMRQALWIATTAVDRVALRYSIAKSIIMIAFFFTMPISMITPTKANRFNSTSNRNSVSKAPRPAAGRPERIVSGWMKFSYRMPSTM